MSQRHRQNGRVGVRIVLAWAVGGVLATAAAGASVDRSLYMSPDELRPGMKGYGRTVMSGAAIQTFQVEVLSVMHNAFYAKQDVILVRCSGLNLEHTGIIGGMSGSPCYIRDDQGRERMIGAVAYGWTFNKDPICGVQPITQMLEVAEVRKPKSTTQPAAPGGQGPASQPVEKRTTGMPLEDWVAKAVGEPVPETSRFSVLNGPAMRQNPSTRDEVAGLEGLRPLQIPVSTSSLHPESLQLMGKWFRRFGLAPVAAAGATRPEQIDPNSVKLEPGSALCVTLMAGDMILDGVGTCTAVIGDKVLAFGHELMGEGSIEYPLSTGFIHGVIPSVARSNKLGGSLKIVGTLWGDETTAVFGTVGRTPTMVPMNVEVTDIRGKQSYHYEVVQEERMTATMFAMGLMESVYAHNALPRDHTVRYSVEVSFGTLGTFRSTGFTAKEGVADVASDLLYPVMTLTNAPLAQKAKVARAKVAISIEEIARSATLDQVTLPKTTYKPGETVTATVRWAHYRHDPMFTYSSYSLTLPEDLPNGDYELSLSSVTGHINALRAEKPYLFRAETLGEALEGLNMIGSFKGDRLYMRLGLKRGGIAYKRTEMPDLPPSRCRILADTKLVSDLSPYSEALVAQHETDFVVSGKQTLQIQVKRRPDP